MCNLFVSYDVYIHTYIKRILFVFDKCCSEVSITGLISNLPTIIGIGKNIYVKAPCH